MLTILVRALLAIVLTSAAPVVTSAAEVWQTLPPAPTRSEPVREGHAPVNGIQLYYAIYGEGDPVILLHGGLGNSDYWGHQIPALAKDHQVIVVDSRGHGRSTRDAQPYSYDL